MQASCTCACTMAQLMTCVSTDYIIPSFAVNGNLYDAIKHVLLTIFFGFAINPFSYFHPILFRNSTAQVFFQKSTQVSSKLYFLTSLRLNFFICRCSALLFCRCRSLSANSVKVNIDKTKPWPISVSKLIFQYLRVQSQQKHCQTCAKSPNFLRYYVSS